MDYDSYLNLLYSCCKLVYSWTSAIMQGNLEYVGKNIKKEGQITAFIYLFLIII